MYLTVVSNTGRLPTTDHMGRIRDFGWNINQTLLGFFQADMSHNSPSYLVEARLLVSEIVNYFMYTQFWSSPPVPSRSFPEFSGKRKRNAMTDCGFLVFEQEIITNIFNVNLPLPTKNGKLNKMITYRLASVMVIIRKTQPVDEDDDHTVGKKWRITLCGRNVSQTISPFD